ncbi:WD repeat protein [Tritrichomonas foetus]|uniref:WD repeat protein n=1 Tax=Tritrichomonas foetus TaxID=1144522 RepID=A0A1J4KWZ7_9EUKA|nr:WD repeat protein [Tritrichomonas foetus]|eukprot:OHT15759.1 WD repeat protein [Tritrichomonas foetus]
MAISLDEINNLVWQYLSESGFQHTAFLFKSESMVDTSDSLSSQIPSGLLISILQKSLLCMNMEKRLNQARKNSDDVLHDRIIELERMFPEQEHPQIEPESLQTDEAIDIKISSSIASILTSHKQSVFTCCFSKDGSKFCTAGEDSTSIVYTIKDGKPTISVRFDENGVYNENRPQTGHAISTIDIDCTGNYLATGSFDSIIRLYTTPNIQSNEQSSIPQNNVPNNAFIINCNGINRSSTKGGMVGKLKGHQNNIFSLKFSPNGKMLVSCSSDNSAILWAIPTGMLLHKFGHSSDTILDVAWRDDTTFAIASADSTISVCSINGSYRVLKGHTSQVTAVTWNRNSVFGTVLASSSEDSTIRIWKEDNQLNYKDCIVLKGHENGVSCIKWLPNSSNWLVSASLDGSLKLWDIQTASCINTISHHADEVITLEVSPNGKYIASGGTDQTIDILNAQNLELLATFIGSSAVFDIKWDPQSRHIAACFDDSTVAIIPIYVYLK